MKIFSIIILLLIEVTLFSQQNTPFPSLTKQDYLLKSKHKKIAAWSLLGGGVVFGSIGAIIAAKEVIPIMVNPFFSQAPDEKNLNTGAVLILIGSASVLASIPFFIASSKNKRIASSISFNNQFSPEIQGNSLVYRAIPSINLKICL